MRGDVGSIGPRRLNDLGRRCANAPARVLGSGSPVCALLTARGRIAVPKAAISTLNASLGDQIMNHHLFNRTTSLCTVVLGLLAAATVGCGSDAIGKQSGAGTDGNVPDAVGVTQQSWIANGCGGVGFFGITSPQIISDVALDQSALASANMQLYTVNDQGVQSLVNQTAQTASSAFQSMVNAV